MLVGTISIAVLALHSLAVDKIFNGGRISISIAHNGNELSNQ